MEANNHRNFIGQAPACICLQAVEDGCGDICDWTIAQLAPAFETMAAARSGELVGRDLAELAKEGAWEWASDLAEHMRQADQSGQSPYIRILGRWYAVSRSEPERGFVRVAFSAMTEALPELPAAEAFAQVNKDLLCAVDDRGRILWTGEGWEAVLGYGPEQLTGMRLWNLVYPEDQKLAAQLIQCLKTPGTARRLWGRCLHRDGGFRHAEWRCQPCGGHVFVFLRDITERIDQGRYLERMLEASEELLQMSCGHVDYERFAEVVRDLSGAKFVVFNLYDRNAQSFVTVSVVGDREDIGRAEKLLGFGLIGRRWPDEACRQMSGGSDIVTISDLSEFGARALTKDLAADLSRVLDVERMVGVKITKGQEMLGEFTMLLSVGKEFNCEDFIAIYARQVGLLMDRIRAEEALQNSEAMLREAQALAELGRWEWDHEEEVLSFSANVGAFLDMDPQNGNISYDEFRAMVWPEDRHKIYRAYLRHRRSGEPYKTSFRVTTSQGENRWLHEIGRTIADENGRPVRTVGTVQDITGIKESEERIQNLLVQNEIIFNGTQDPLFFVRVKDGPSFVYIKCNRAYQEATGCALSALQGKSPRGVFGPHTGGRIHRGLSRCVNKGEPITFEETLALGGQTRLWNTALTPVFEGGRVAYIVGVSQDITERRQFENKVLSQLKRNQVMLNVLERSPETEQEYLDYALNQALELTDSQYGYIYLYDEQTRIFTLNSWSGQVSEDCRTAEKQTRYTLDSTGIWGEAVRQRKAVLVNDFSAPNPLKRGCPEGHVSIRSFLTVPVFDEGRIVAVVGMANKPTEYGGDDISQLTILMSNVWAVIQRRRTEILLKQEKELFKATLLSIGDGILATDHGGRVILLNEVAQKLTGHGIDQAYGRPFEEIFHVVDERSGRRRENIVQKVLETGKAVSMNDQTVLVSGDGSRYPVSCSASPIVGDDGKIRGAVTAFRNIEPEKQKMEMIEYLSYHDLLTGLYNRAFFEEELRRLNTKRNLPLCIVLADANGLKLTNDAFGHAAGDKLLQKAAEVMRACCREDDIIARTGGDEFVILLPKTDAQAAGKLVERIHALCTETRVGLMPLSISFGWAAKTTAGEDIREVQKKAEDHMYRQKLVESPRMRAQTIDIIAGALYQVDEYEERHSRRVADLCKAMGKALDLAPREQRVLVGAGLLHDIGKIAVDRKILLKKGPLTSEEWHEIRRHPESGYRILSSVGDMAEIAQAVLAHHERWDGGGYPKGLSGRDIPISGRVLALADAYDTMVSDKPYRAAISRKEALQQLRENAGKAFDPELTEMFVGIISNLPE